MLIQLIKRGTVKFFSPEKGGFGFISPQKGKEGVYFHLNSFVKVTEKTPGKLTTSFTYCAIMPKVGVEVFYYEIRTKKGVKAQQWGFAENWDRAVFVIAQREGSPDNFRMRIVEPEEDDESAVIWEGSYIEFRKKIEKGGFLEILGKNSFKAVVQKLTVNGWEKFDHSRPR